MQLKSSEIYLFGSEAKGCYSSKSYIDLLVLINYSKTSKELRMLRHEIEDNLVGIQETNKAVEQVAIVAQNANGNCRKVNSISFKF